MNTRPFALSPVEASVVIGMAQMEVFPGDPARNGARMLEMISDAREKGVDLLVFPEMCLPGYLIGDMWERPAFLRECESWTRRIVAATSAADAIGARPMAVVFGTVIPDWAAKGEDGRPRKYNGYIVAIDGRAIRHPGLGRDYGIKTLLPNYREFEEPRHFHDARKLAMELDKPLEDLLEPVPIPLNGKLCRAGIILCEDAWEEDYAQKPLEILGLKGCDFLLNLSCSPFTQGKNEKRNRVFARKAKALGRPLFYVNCISLQNNGKTLFTFDGRGTAYGPDGVATAEMAAYKQDILPVTVEWRKGKPKLAKGVGPPVPDQAAANSEDMISPPAEDAQTRRIREIHQALRYGARAFLASINQDRVVIGVSGGIDSAVAAAFYRDILPPQNLLLVNMPSRFNSGTTRNLSKALAENLGCLYTEIDIEASMAVTKSQLDGLEIRSPDGSLRASISMAGFVMENVQARDRSSRILAALAASFGGVFTCNANKAELTVGYSTLYGDLGGYLALLGDLWKSEVYALGRFLNAEVFRREVIPEGVFTIVPSAELSDTQAVDEGKGDPLVYPYHDKLFFSWVQRWNRATPEEILEWYAEGSLAANLGLDEGVNLDSIFPSPAAFIRDLERWWNLYSGIAVAKRVQAPPIMAVSSRAFGFDHREALGPAFYSERYLALRAELLKNSGGGFGA